MPRRTPNLNKTPFIYGNLLLSRRMIPAYNNTQRERERKRNNNRKRFFLFLPGSHNACWQSCLGPVVESKQAFSPPRSSDRASFLEEVMISLLNEFSGRWPRQDKQSAAEGEKWRSRAVRSAGGGEWKEENSGPRAPGQ